MSRKSRRESKPAPQEDVDVANQVLARSQEEDPPLIAADADDDITRANERISRGEDSASAGEIMRDRAALNPPD